MVPALAAGVLVGLSVPPWGWWVLAFPGLALLSWRLAGLRARARVLAGMVAGVGWFALTIAWMAQFNVAGGVLADVGEAAFVALACLLTPRGRGRHVAFPAALVLGQSLVARWPFGGEPLGGIQLGQVAGPLAGTARLGGPLLVIATTAAAGVVVAGLVAGGRAGGPDGRDGRGRRAPLGVVVGGLVVVAVAVLADWAPDGGTARRQLRVAAVQGGGRRGLHRLERDPGIVFQAQLDASAEITAPRDLVLWPENVIDLDVPLNEAPEARAVADLARRLGATVVAGVTEPAGEEHFHNAAVAWGPDGRELGRYEKRRRVPFGEYVPGRTLIRHLVNLSLIPREAIPGRGSNVLATPAGRLGILVSYEVFFADRARDALRHHAELLLVPTNAASFSTSQVPTQEVAAARLRAIETGRDLVQAAPTGYTAIADHRGKLRRRTRLGRRQVITGVVGLRRGRTVYDRVGDAPVLLVVAVGLGAAWGREVSLSR